MHKISFLKQILCDHQNERLRGLCKKCQGNTKEGVTNSAWRNKSFIQKNLQDDTHLSWKLKTEGNPRQSRWMAVPLTQIKQLDVYRCVSEALVAFSAREVKTLTIWSILKLRPYKYEQLCIRLGCLLKTHSANNVLRPAS